VTPVSIHRGDGPLVLSFPHSGRHIPADICEDLAPSGRTLADTDWHVDRLYGGLLCDVTTVTANFHRYVIDANRDPSGASLYPGQNTTGLVPLTDFGGQALWCNPPAEEDIQARCRAWHTPYHAALSAELERVKSIHGLAVLYDCHSIRSQAPYLFEGVLPDFNIGTNNGDSCDALLECAVAEVCSRAESYSMVVNGRFRGGWTTRHYGRPDTGIHAIQMELAQSTYLASETPPFAYDSGKAARLREHLAGILQTLAYVALQLKERGTT
jgi:formiminoglutamase